MEKKEKRVDINSSLEDIFELTNCIITPEQIMYITRDEKIINDFIDLCKKTKRDSKEIKKFLIKNQDKLNKGKLLVLLVYSYKTNIELIKTEIIPEAEKEIESLESQLKRRTALSMCVELIEIRDKMLESIDGAEEQKTRENIEKLENKIISILGSKPATERKKFIKEIIDALGITVPEKVKELESKLNDLSKEKYKSKQKDKSESKQDEIFKNILSILTSVEPEKVKEIESELKKIPEYSELFDPISEKNSKIRMYKEQLEAQTKCMKNAIKLLKDVDEILPIYTRDQKTGMVSIKVIDSIEMSNGQKRNTSNRGRLEEIDAGLERIYDESEVGQSDGDLEEDDKSNRGNGYRGRGLDYINMALLMTDFETFFDYKEDPKRVIALANLGDYIRTMILENAVVGKAEEEKRSEAAKTLEKIREEDINKYNSIIEDDENYHRVISKIKPTFIEYAPYIDIDRMLLVSAYRIEELIERKYREKTLASLVDTKDLSAEEKIEQEAENEKLVCDNLRIILEYIRNILIMNALKREGKSINNIIEPEDDKSEDIHQLINKALKQKNPEIMDILQEKHRFRLEPKKGEVVNGELGDDGRYDLEISPEDINKCITRLEGGKYISKEEIETIRKQVLSGEKYLDEFEISVVYKAFQDEGIVTAIDLSDRNFIYYVEATNIYNEAIIAILIGRKKCSEELVTSLLEKEKLNNESVIKLYEVGLLSIDYMCKIKDQYDLSSVIKQSELLQTYILATQKDATEDDVLKYKRCLDLYKHLYIIEKDESEIEESSQKMIEQLIEADLNEDYIIYLEDMYKNGLITIDTILMWEPKDILFTFYKDGLIDIEYIHQLADSEKISLKDSEQLIRNIVRSGMIKQDELIELLYNGYIDDEDILIKLYTEGRILEGELETLLDTGAISESTYNNIMFELDKMSEAEESFDADDFEKIQPEDESDDYHFPVDPTYYPDIINPLAKQIFFELLRLRPMANTTDEDNQFHDYELWRLVDEKLRAQGITLVLAERDYMDRENQEQYAVNNATYFFLNHSNINGAKKSSNVSNLNNEDSNNNNNPNQGLIFRKYHNIAELSKTETSEEITIEIQKTGSWAYSVLFGLVECIEGDKLDYEKDSKRVSRKLIELYGVKRLKEIMDFAKRIDRGDFNCKLVDEGSGAVAYNPYAIEDYLEEVKRKKLENQDLDDGGPGEPR